MGRPHRATRSSPLPEQPSRSPRPHLHRTNLRAKPHTNSDPASPVVYQVVVPAIRIPLPGGRSPSIRSGEHNKISTLSYVAAPPRSFEFVHRSQIHGSAANEVLTGMQKA
jgi:hypothetical protein